VTSQDQMAEADARAAGWLHPHRQRFVEDLRALGYKPWTLRRYEDIALRFCAAVEVRGLGVDDLDGSRIEQLHVAIVDATTAAAGTYMRFCLNRFINHLVAARVACLPEPPPKVPTALELLHQEYDAYLRNQRGLSDSTIYHCHRFMDRFMTFRFGVAPAILMTFHRTMSSRSCAKSGAVTSPIGTRHHHRICVPCSGFRSGAARRSAIW
jgi:integrase/recombinase XerD